MEFNENSSTIGPEGSHWKNVLILAGWRCYGFISSTVVLRNQDYNVRKFSDARVCNTVMLLINNGASAQYVG